MQMLRLITLMIMQALPTKISSKEMAKEITNWVPQLSLAKLLTHFSMLV